MRTRLGGLYGITDSILLPDESTLLTAVEAALKGGMSLLQYRDKTSAVADRLQQALSLKGLCHRYGALLIINDDVELAAKIAADGVHLGRQDSDIGSARLRLGERAIIGCSCYGRLDLALEAERQGADYVAFGRFFPSQTKPEASPADPALLGQARERLDIPVCAIGGINTDNAQGLIDQGADMLAVIHDLFSSDEVYQRALDFSRFFESKVGT